MFPGVEAIRLGFNVTIAGYMVGSRHLGRAPSGLHQVYGQSGGSCSKTQQIYRRALMKIGSRGVQYRFHDLRHTGYTRDAGSRRAVFYRGDDYGMEREQYGANRETTASRWALGPICPYRALWGCFSE